MSTDAPMIILEDRSTWPQSITDLISSRISCISKERDVEQLQNLEGRSWLSTIPDSRYLEARQQLALLLRRYSIKAYHCTRVLAPDNITQTGLVPLNQATLTAGLLHALDVFPAPDIHGKAEAEIQLYVKNGTFESQRGLLWFYPMEKQTLGYDCRDLFEYFGGRALRAALFKLRYRFYPLLKRIGTPVVIGCRVRIADGTTNQVEELARLMLDQILDEANNRVAHPVQLEFSIGKPVHPTDILETQEQLHHMSKP